MKKNKNTPSNWFHLQTNKPIIKYSKEHEELESLLLEITTLAEEVMSHEAKTAQLIELTSKNQELQQNLDEINNIEKDIWEALVEIEYLKQIVQAKKDSIVKINNLENQLKEIGQSSRGFEDNYDETYEHKMYKKIHFSGMNVRTNFYGMRDDDSDDDYDRGYDDHLSTQMYNDMRGDRYEDLQAELKKAEEAFIYSIGPSIETLTDDFESLWTKTVCTRKLEARLEKFNHLLPSLEDEEHIISTRTIFDQDWYTEDNIAQLLQRLLPNERFHIIAQTQFENDDLLRANLNQAVANIIGNPDHVALMPVHLHGNHWIGMMMHQQANGDIQVVIINPTGGEIEEESNAALLIQILENIIEELGDGNHLRIADLMLHQQYNGYDCGPFTVDNLVRLAYNAHRLDHLSPEDIVEIAHLQWPGEAGAREIREAHNLILRAEIMPANQTLNIPHIESYISLESDFQGATNRSSAASENTELDAPMVHLFIGDASASNYM